VLFETDDGALIETTNRGVWHGSPEVIARIAAGKHVDPSEYEIAGTPVWKPATKGING